MHKRDAVFLEDLCPKLRDRRWRKSLHEYTGKRCIYCGENSESIDHVLPRSKGGLSITENCVPACLSCNGSKQTKMLLNGTENNVFTTQGDQWLLELGLRVTYD